MPPKKSGTSIKLSGSKVATALDDLLCQIGILQVEQQRVDAAHRRALKNLTNEHALATKDSNTLIKSLAAQAKRLVKTHEAELIGDGSKGKTIHLEHGSVGVRLSKPSIKLLQSVEQVKDALRQMRWTWLLKRKVTVEINKRQMLRYPRRAVQVPGVSIVQRKIFFFTPTASGVEVSIEEPSYPYKPPKQ